ncbi:MAG: serine hydrolase domain-containing protein [Gemmatimonadota bacterium]
MMRNGEVVCAEATGLINREAGTAPTVNTRFGIASATKAFTGMALLKLVEQGKIDLDAEIQAYVPEFPRNPQGPVSYQYSSYGYNLPGMAIQRASGVPYQKFVQDSVLTPLGLTTVAFDHPGMDGRARPVRYSWYDLRDFHDLTDSAVPVPDWDYSHNMAAGNLVSSVTDLLKFARAMRSPGFLSPASWALVWQRPKFGAVVRSEQSRPSRDRRLECRAPVWRDGVEGSGPGGCGTGQLVGQRLPVRRVHGGRQRRVAGAPRGGLRSYPLSWRLRLLGSGEPKLASRRVLA